jgi:hypothetical protein
MEYIIHDAYPAGKSNAGSREAARKQSREYLKVEYGMLLFSSWRDAL